MNCPKCHHENPPESTYCGKCATRLDSPRPNVTETMEPPREELTTGSTFAGRFQIIEELGHGGMGRVYKVHDNKIGEKIALKLIRPEAGLNKETLERFSNELKLARKIRHKNVCQMFDLGEDKGTRYITMEYVHGEDLRQLIRKVGRLSPGQAIAVARQVCAGLEEAHKLGVVHRDLKPQNIMLDEDGAARIMDFGIARSLTGKSITGAGTFIGTPEYMSPEQVEGKEADARSDIYSLGIILYEMVAGRRPFDGETALSIAHKHKYEAPEDPRTINPQIPERLAQVILRCLEKDKARRYQAAEELRADLGAVEKDVPATESAAARKPLTSREITVTFRLKKLVVPAAALLAVIAAGIVLLKVLPRKGSGPPSAPLPSAAAPARPDVLLSGTWSSSVAVLPFANMSANPEQDDFCDGMAVEIINALIQVEGLRIVNRASAFSFKGKNIDVREIGRELGVEAVLEGTVRRAGSRLRITAQLVNVADGFYLWSERFDRDLADVFAIQDEIARAVVDKLEVKLLGKKKGALVKRLTIDSEAYDAFLKAGRLVDQGTEDGFKRAEDLYEGLVEKYPDFAPALVGLGGVNVSRSYWGNVRPHDAYPKAKEYTRRALEIDGSLGEAYSASGFVKAFYDWDWTGAERDFKRALELNPNSSWIHQAYAMFLTCVKRHEEAVIEAKKAQSLDPLSVGVNNITARVLYHAGRSDEAVELLRATIILDPSSWLAHYTLGLIYGRRSMDRESLAENEKAFELSGGTPIVAADLLIEYQSLGRTAEAERLEKGLRDRARTEYVSPITFFGLHLIHNEVEQAAGYLEKACMERDSFLPWLLADPHPEIIRIFDLPVFKDILKKYGLK